MDRQKHGQCVDGGPGRLWSQRPQSNPHMQALGTASAQTCSAEQHHAHCQINGYSISPPANSFAAGESFVKQSKNGIRNRVSWQQPPWTTINICACVCRQDRSPSGGLRTLQKAQKGPCPKRRKKAPTRRRNEKLNEPVLRGQQTALLHAESHALRATCMHTGLAPT